ncbi:hypothetical protein PAXRUDRAFT_141272, partial [Paxillus rubicundulus Ve08.2h10]
SDNSATTAGRLRTFGCDGVATGGAEGMEVGAVRWESSTAGGTDAITERARRWQKSPQKETCTCSELTGGVG